MQKVLIRALGIVCLVAGLCIGGSSQPVEQFRVTNTGIAPIKMTFDSVGADQIYVGAMEVINAICNGLCSISGDGSKSIQVDATQQMAFTALEGGFLTSFDVKFTLTIRISESQMNLEYKVGEMYPQGRTKPSQLTYFDFFKKNGTVKDNYAKARESLERSINALPLDIYQHLKKNFRPKLVSNQNERGYVRAGARISLWQYYDSKGGSELVINHTNGKLIYQRPDTSRYFVIKNGSVMRSKLDVRPMPVNGFQNLFISIQEAFRVGRPSLFFNCKMLGQEKLLVAFDVDTLGFTKNWTLVNSTGVSRCDSTVLASLKSNKTEWIPAISQKRKLVTRLAIPVLLTSNKVDSSNFPWESVAATCLDQLILPIPKLGDVVFDSVENSAEFIGGLNALSKWLSQNLKYPPSARRMGLEGKVTVKFIIEPDGAISNINLLRGFDGACDKEAMRVISIMPKWKPGTVGGTPVRHWYVMPITFRLGR